MSATDTHLERVKDLQQAFKSEAVRAVAVAVARKAYEAGEVWPDDVNHDAIREDDRNCIGSVFRLLRNIGIIERTNDFRRSTAEGAKGRTIFGYRLTSGAEAKCRTFLLRNQAKIPPEQSELFLQER